MELISRRLPRLPDSALAHRAKRAMDGRHRLQMQLHQAAFGNLGQLETKTQRRRLKEANAKAKAS